MPIASLTTGEPEIAAMGTEAAEGHISAAPYFQRDRKSVVEGKSVDLGGRRIIKQYKSAFP